VIAFIGPTGVGKTTTIAKLAAKFAVEENVEVGLITADTYRIAAVQQLQTYSDIMNIPLEVVYNESELAKNVKANYDDYDLIFVDTAGSSWNDQMQMGRLKKFTELDLVDETHLLVSLNTKSEDLRNIIEYFSHLNPDKMILTKLDETTIYGDIINLNQDYELPYSYITYGQDVPDDIREADSDLLLDYVMGDLYE
jgi:flagellar biosynthesis protein FlhF